MSEIDRDLLTREGVAAAVSALKDNYGWFISIKIMDDFYSVQKSGLRPNKQGCLANPVVAASIGSLICSVDEMIFFRPLGKGVHDSTPRRGEGMFVVAVAADNMPEILTIDWTMDGTWGLASIIKEDCPDWDNSLIFCEVVRRRGSVVAYKEVPAKYLRVLVKGLSIEDPSDWPYITSVASTDVTLIF
jgi:hypothetical protein